MPLSQAHEQNNDTVNGAGAAVGLTENPAALQQWTLAGPDQIKILSKFEDIYCTHGQHNGITNKGMQARKPLRNRLPTSAT